MTEEKARALQMQMRLATTSFIAATIIPELVLPRVALHHYVLSQGMYSPAVIDPVVLLPPARMAKSKTLNPVRRKGRVNPR